MTELTQTWGFTQVWNSSLLQRQERDKRVRDHLWASELGKAPIDILLSMKGEKPTNPPNARSLRKFEAGNIWEWIISLILLRAGILKANQAWCSFRYPAEGKYQPLEVTGKADFIAGGIPEIARANLEELQMPEIFIRAGVNIINYLNERYPNGLDEQPLEIKSCSSFMFDVYSTKQDASKNHKMQLFHYLKAMNYPKGTIVYVSRDDCRMLEIPVTNPGPVEEDYKGHIDFISQHYSADMLPPKEHAIVFDDQLGKFAKNWHVAYSQYLTKLYNLKDQHEFDERYAPTVARWNRVLKRVLDDANMTDKNLEVIEEIKSEGFKWDEVVNQARLSVRGGGEA